MTSRARPTRRPQRITPVRVRQAILRRALRDGDVPAISRAVARLRLRGVTIGPHELAQARPARRHMGRALFAARQRRLTGETARVVIAIRPEPGITARDVRRIVALSGALVFCVIFLAIRLVVTPPPAAPLGEPAAVSEPESARVQLRTVSRGRTAPSAPPVIAVVEEVAPTPAPSASPQPTASAASVGPRAGQRPGSTGVPGGVPGGVEGGIPGGRPGGSPTARPATPKPTPTPGPLLPAPVPAAYDRFMFVVVDSASGRPLSGVCVQYGTTACGEERPHTNELGLWWLDLPRDPIATDWTFRFVLPRYFPVELHVSHTPGTSQLMHVRLPPRR